MASAGNKLLFAWTGPGVPQTAANLAGPYADLPGAKSPYTADLGAGTVFYRLRR